MIAEGVELRETGAGLRHQVQAGSAWTAFACLLDDVDVAVAGCGPSHMAPSVTASPFVAARTNIGS